MEANIPSNNNKGVVNYIMGSCVFIVMSTTKRWIPIRSMGCVHTHGGILVIEGRANPSRIRNVVEKTRKVN